MPKKQQQLTKAMATKLIQSYNMDALSGEQLLQLFREEKDLHQYIPENYGEIDPRSNERVLFNPARATRPNADSHTKKTSTCPICAGKTTQIIDYSELSSGFTFTNKNLFPAIFPHPEVKTNTQSSNNFPAWGMHLLQWTSSFHDRDWHNMEIEDLVIVMDRLAAIERHLLTEFSGISKHTGWQTDSQAGHVSMIKNGGLGSGGSLEHGHQQIVFSNILPRRIIENNKFEQAHGQVFSKFMLEQNPVTLVIQDFGEAVLLVPYFMRRPYNMLLIVKDTSKKYIHHLSNGERVAVCKGWKTAISAIHRIMEQNGLLISYNVITHNGPGAGLYFEFLPRSQTEGGFELIGLSVCQSSPEIAAEQIRETLNSK
ncbi:MAG: hypothetical protein P8Y72_15300 [Anaerolineales bacterium]|jgi:galactose-1-phosphate uridylyltransferase